MLAAFAHSISRYKKKKKKKKEIDISFTWQPLFPYSVLFVFDILRDYIVSSYLSTSRFSFISLPFLHFINRLLLLSHTRYTLKKKGDIK